MTGRNIELSRDQERARNRIKHQIDVALQALNTARRAANSNPGCIIDVEPAALLAFFERLDADLYALREEAWIAPGTLARHLQHEKEKT